MNTRGKCLLFAGWELRHNIHSSFLLFFCLLLDGDVCPLKSHRKCHFTHPCEFVNSLLEICSQEKAISSCRTFSTPNMSSLMSPVPVKTSDAVHFYNKLLHCDETPCCIWYVVAESKTVLWVTHLSAAHSFCSFQLYGRSTFILTNIDLTFTASSVT